MTNKKTKTFISLPVKENIIDIPIIKKMKVQKNNPASFHYHAILKDAVINPTKAYFFNSWQCSSPDECQEYAIAMLRKKFDYSDNQIVKLIKEGE
jgi:hypothetical protein